MKLNHECVRSLLLTVEDASFSELKYGIGNEDLPNKERLKEFSKDEIEYNAMLLIQAGYLSGINSSIDLAGNIMFDLNGLTWQGHQFLDTIRDPKVWSDTKKVASKFASISLSLTEKIASNVILGLIRKETGLPL